MLILKLFNVSPQVTIQELTDNVIIISTGKKAEGLLSLISTKISSYIKGDKYIFGYILGFCINHVCFCLPLAAVNLPEE